MQTPWWVISAILYSSLSYPKQPQKVEFDTDLAYFGVFQNPADMQILKMSLESNFEQDFMEKKTKHISQKVKGQGLKYIGSSMYDKFFL